MKRLYQLGSATNAMHAKRILDKHGIRSYLRRETDPSGKLGCGYALLVTGNTTQAEMILRQHGVTILGVKGREEK